jgi:hypothetical protein
LNKDLIDETDGMTAQQREAYVLFGVGMLAYAVTFPIALYVSKHADVGAVKWFLLALPIVATAVIAWSVIRYVAALDELQWRIQSEGLAYGFAITMVMTVGVGVMELWMRITIPWWIRFPFMVCAWQFGVLLARTKYR